jgi:2-C-methyl-D-erythritol 4-phosphate cytidylyltransferase
MPQMNQVSVIITAGGIGKRMGGNLPKQFISLSGKPILLRTLECFAAFDPTIELIVTLPVEWHAYWKECLKEFDCTISHTLVSGGEERFHSIKNALHICTGEFILVHDGVRPFVANEMIQACLDVLQAKEAVVPVLPIKESLRQRHGSSSKAVDRSNFLLVQTPQCFRSNILRKAYDQEYHSGITDDATLVESLGIDIQLIEGNEDNIKITTQKDLIIAEAILASQNKE